LCDEFVIAFLAGERIFDLRKPASVAMGLWICKSAGWYAGGLGLGAVVIGANRKFAAMR